MIQGDAYYQSYICRIPRSTIELGLTGRLDCMDGMLFPSICDVIRNLSGMWQILFKDKYVRYIDVPQNYIDSIGGNFYIQEMQTLREDLGKLRGSPITDEELNASIAVYNDNRVAIDELYKYRAAKPWQAPTSEVYLLLRAGMVLPPEEHTKLVREYLVATDAEPRPKRDNARVVINGSFCEQPPLALIKSIEMSGCYIVDDDFMLVTRWLLDEVPANASPLDELSKAFLHRSATTAAKYDTTREEKGMFLLKQVQDARRRGRRLRRAVVLRPGAARAADAAGRDGAAQDSLHRLQVRGEHRPDGPDPRTGRHFRRFDQVVECQMNTAIQMPVSKKAKPVAIKDDAMNYQKELINSNYLDLAKAHGEGRKVAATFVPGNLNELLMCFDLARSLPETNALQNGLRKKSGKFIMDAERDGHSEDVCTYVKSDLGSMMGGEIGPTGDALPEPDILLLSYTGCFTFMKWFELIRHKYGCETVMLHVPYQGDGKIQPNMREYVVKQLKETVIPTLERISGVKFDIDRLREYMRESAKAEEDLVKVLQSAKNRPSPIDGYFGAVYYIGPIFTAFRGTPEATDVLPHAARGDRGAGARWARARSRPTATWAKRSTGWSSKARPTGPASASSGRCSTTKAPWWSSSTYAKVGGLYDFGFRHDPEHPLESLADYCLGCYTNLNLPSRIDMICKYIDEYQADGLLINSIKSCNSFSAGQLLILREVEKRTGKPAAFVETDLVDPRYFSAANVKNRLESYFQMVKQKRTSLTGAH